jgi:hypothetical protein
LQESREILERLRRMENFESQDFDVVVRLMKSFGIHALSSNQRVPLA